MTQVGSTEAAAGEAAFEKDWKSRPLQTGDLTMKNGMAGMDPAGGDRSRYKKRSVVRNSFGQEQLIDCSRY